MEKMGNTTSRRSSLKKMGMALFGAFGLGVVNAVAKDSAPKKEVVGKIEQDKKIPLFSGAVRHGNTLYIAGKGAHFEGDIKSHTDHVLNSLKTELERNGSSMEQVLKVNVYLHDLTDYHGMNSIFRGRFGENPPVRTTVATYGGVPGDSLVEIDCIAAVE